MSRRKRGRGRPPKPKNLGRPRKSEEGRRERFEVWMTKKTHRRLTRLCWAYDLDHVNDAIELAARLTSPLPRDEEDGVLDQPIP